MDLNTLLNSGFQNMEAMEEHYARYKQDPNSVTPAWRQAFEQINTIADELEQNQTIVPLSSAQPQLTENVASDHSVLYHPKLEFSTDHSEWRIYHLIEAYRTYGHYFAHTNPIEIAKIEEPPQLQLETLGFSKQELPSLFPTCGLLPEEQAPLLDIINTLKAIYCNKVGIEYMGMRGPAFEAWMQERIEPSKFTPNLTIDQKHMILQYLNKSELLESFLHTKYVGQKRFSIEGAETLIPMMAAAIDVGASYGIDEYIIGMAHRGRLNMLCNIFDKSYAEVFSEFEEGYIPSSVEGSGDVKYHKGFYSEVKTVHGHKIKLTLTPNPSHLESVNAVVEGQVRARQILRDDEESHKKVVPILIHGDAAIAGQGVVYETLQLSNLEGYSTGGTIHFIINNNIGFTTLPKDARSTCYCTDIAKTFSFPVFHVNAEDPEACVYVTTLAIEIRQKFHCDVFIELNCYRKYGHNESDEPSFTQPLEYQVIRKKTPIRDLYRDLLIQQSVLEKQIAESLEAEFKDALHQAQNLSANGFKDKKKINNKKNNNGNPFQAIQTAVEKSTLQEIGERICKIPETLTIHSKLQGLTRERLSMVQKEGARPLDWGMAELLAYGSILWEGKPVRLTGQDTCRGTFSHRHALLMDQVKEVGYVPLRHLKEGQGRFDVYNSPLSEFAALGFEFGYSVANPDALVIWEAQFGDFANGGQVVIDQFISPGEQKWGQKSGITLLLPHGYEGQGPEHSSGRMERFLTLAGDNNMQIVNPTTPAQLFHLLRRQASGQYRKPLIIFTPKGLLRHPACTSTLDDLSKGAFEFIIDDATAPKRPKRLVLCSGRIYYDLIAEREKTETQDMVIIRIEQLYPFNIDRFKEVVSKYTTIKECIWAQEEPSNMGAWGFLRPVLREVLPKSIELTYVGRPRSAASAVGSHAIHKKEHTAIMNALFGEKEKPVIDITSQLKA